MKREQFNEEKEMQIVGHYPPIKGAIWYGPHGMPAMPQYYRPIEPRENFKMIFRGETPYWIPDCGPLTTDIMPFRPRQHPDNMANHMAFDGGDFVDFDAEGPIRKGWLGIEWKFEPGCGGASPAPGKILIPDISEWEKYVTMPNLDDMDWKGTAEMNREYLGTDRANQLGLQSSLWERLMDAMGVSDAAVALIDEDMQDGVHRFFDALADLYIDYIRRTCDCCRIDSIVMHDDWGTQNAPFFSLDTCREMIVPHFKRIVDACHELGLVFEHHCCGNAQALVPAMLECGTDYWMPQPALNDLDYLVNTYKGEKLIFAVSSPKLAPELTEDQIEELAAQWVEKYKDKRLLLAPNMIFAPDNDFSKYPLFKNAVYRYSRQAYQNLDA